MMEYLEMLFSVLIQTHLNISDAAIKFSNSIRMEIKEMQQKYSMLIRNSRAHRITFNEYS